MTAVDLDALDAARAGALRESVARWAADPGEPIGAEEWPTLASGFRAFLRSRADLLLEQPEMADLIAEARKYRALQEAVEALAVSAECQPVGLHYVSARLLRAAVATVDGTA